MSEKIPQLDNINVKKIAGLFKAAYHKGPWPNESQCYGVVVATKNIQKSPPAAAKNDSPTYRRRQATIQRMRRLINERKKAYQETQDQFPNVRLPADVKAISDLAALEKALGDAEEALCPSDPLAGERSSARWHKPARFLAERVEQALRDAGHTNVLYDRDGPFIRMMVSLLALIGESHEAGAVAAALTAAPK